MKYGGIKQEKIRGREGEKTSEVEGGRENIRGIRRERFYEGVHWSRF